jgi:hypothetical protein
VSAHPLGARVLRVDDGMKGAVEIVAGEARVTYWDRGERIVAPKTEKWDRVEDKTHPLRREEILEVAMEADRALRAIERHEPSRWWQPVNLEATPYDAGLVGVVVAYLRAR